MLAPYEKCGNTIWTDIVGDLVPGYYEPALRVQLKDYFASTIGAKIMEGASQVGKDQRKAAFRTLKNTSHLWAPNMLWGRQFL